MKKNDTCVQCGNDFGGVRYDYEKGFICEDCFEEFIYKEQEI